MSKGFFATTIATKHSGMGSYYRGTVPLHLPALLELVCRGVQGQNFRFNPEFSHTTVDHLNNIFMKKILSTWYLYNLPDRGFELTQKYPQMHEKGCM
jgi:hypothetical protein